MIRRLDFIAFSVFLLLTILAIFSNQYNNIYYVLFSILSISLLRISFNENSNYKCLSISRIDFDKHTELILKANRLINDDKIYIFGAENRLFVHHTLSKLGLKEDFEKYWMKKFPKNLPLTDSNSNNLLNNCEYVADMSIIKGDGGGTQYTFLEAIYNDCVLILHKDWVNQGRLFKDKHNCYVVGDTDKPEQEIANIINNPNKKLDKKIIKNAKLILENHTKKDFF